MISQFKPAWWMTNRHVQTIMPRFFRPFHHTRYELEQLDTPDGDFIELAWSLPHNETAPLAVVLYPVAVEELPLAVVSCPIAVAYNSVADVERPIAVEEPPLAFAR